MKDLSEKKRSITKSEAIDAVLKIAEKEIGYLEKKSARDLDSKTGNAGSNNYTKYWRDVKASYQGQPWCGAFVSWCFMKAFGLENRNHKIRRQKHICIITPGDLKSQRLQRQERKSPETHLDRRCQHHLRPQNLSGIQKRGSCRRRRMRTRNLERPDRDLKNKNAGTPVNSRVSGISCKLASLLNSGPGGN